MTDFEKLRTQLEQKVSKYGLSHPVVLKLSQKLDMVHNSYLKKVTK